MQIEIESLSEETRFKILTMQRLDLKFPFKGTAKKLKYCQSMYEDAHRSDISSEMERTWHS